MISVPTAGGHFLCFAVGLLTWAIILYFILREAPVPNIDEAKPVLEQAKAHLADDAALHWTVDTRETYLVMSHALLIALVALIPASTN